MSNTYSHALKLQVMEQQALSMLFATPELFEALSQSSRCAQGRPSLARHGQQHSYSTADVILPIDSR